MTCKLTYFNLRALGEPIRMILTYNGIKFQDIRLDRFGKDWIEKKSTFPMGQLPLLEIDGIALHQSKVICRYLAKKSDLYGKNERESAQIDIAVDIIYDLIMKMRVLRDISDPSAQETKYEEFKNTSIPFYLSNLDNIAKSYSGYLGCSKLSWADFYFTGAIDYLENLCRIKFRDDYPNLKKVIQNVTEEPKLKEYLSKRTNSEL
ncbi:glutathione S-transferase-like [Arctopsyche grandis]|uniref:glutathione S-transferase-like n=1 Tax=Arctopsyche grandis TaxID=121162 RepID=UPI00406D9234